MVPTINKPNRLTKETASAIGHRITNRFVENTLERLKLFFKISVNMTGILLKLIRIQINLIIIVFSI